MHALQQRINTVFYSEAGPTRVKDSKRELDMIRMDADDLARQYPENMTLASHAADWGCALLLINAAGQATKIERSEFLNKARQHLAVSENALRTCLQDYPESINFTHLLGEVLLNQAEVTNDLSWFSGKWNLLRLLLASCGCKVVSEDFGMLPRRYLSGAHTSV